MPIDPNMAQLLTDFQSWAANNNQYLEGTGTQRQWMVPTNHGVTFDPLAISALGNAFERTALNSDYGDENDPNVAPTNKLHTVMAYNLQIGYLGAAERAFRERHKTLPRQILHNAGRKKAHGDAAGVFNTSIRDHITTLLAFS